MCSCGNVAGQCRNSFHVQHRRNTRREKTCTDTQDILLLANGGDRQRGKLWRSGKCGQYCEILSTRKCCQNGCCLLAAHLPHKRMRRWPLQDLLKVCGQNWLFYTLPGGLLLAAEPLYSLSLPTHSLTQIYHLHCNRGNRVHPVRCMLSGPACGPVFADQTCETQQI